MEAALRDGAAAFCKVTSAFGILTAWASRSNLVWVARSTEGEMDEF